jgi:hypothetical protein
MPCHAREHGIGRSKLTTKPPFQVMAGVIRLKPMQVRLTKPLRPDGRDERSCLSGDRDYTVLSIEYNMYRLIDDFGEPTLHDVDAFITTNNEIPEFWIAIHTEDVDFDGPECLNVPGYFEDWHNSNPNTRMDFQRALALYYPDVIADFTPRRMRQAHTGG